MEMKVCVSGRGDVPLLSHLCAAASLHPALICMQSQARSVLQHGLVNAHCKSEQGLGIVLQWRTHGTGKPIFTDASQSRPTVHSAHSQKQRARG